MTKTISLACDPGSTGALVALDDDRRILFTQKFRSGVPRGDFQLHCRTAPGQVDRLVVTSGDKLLEFYCTILVTVETHDWHVNEIKKGGKVWPNSIYDHGKQTGRIYQWLVDRGFGKLILEVQAAKWQGELLKGCFGGTSKKKAEHRVMMDYCKHGSGAQCCAEIEWRHKCKGDCQLHKHGIYGPKSGYDKDKGDALLIANWRLNQERMKG